MSQYIDKLIKKIESDKRQFDAAGIKFFKEYRFGFPRRSYVIWHEGEVFWGAPGSTPQLRTSGTLREIIKALVPGMSV